MPSERSGTLFFEWKLLRPSRVANRETPPPSDIFFSQSCQIHQPFFFRIAISRLLLVAVAIVVCLLVIRSAATFGFSRLLTTYSLISGNLAAAKSAVELTPRDAEAHFANAAVLSLSAGPQQSLIELEHAVVLRPADYTLWQQLGLLRDQLGDTAGALAAFDEAVKRAPYYSQPRWNRGNVLLRKGEYEAAFNDLSQAAQSNPELLPNLIDLAWGVSRGDVRLTEELAQIKSDKMRIAFTRFLAQRGKGEGSSRPICGRGERSRGDRARVRRTIAGKGCFQRSLRDLESYASSGRGQGSGRTFDLRRRF